MLIVAALALVVLIVIVAIFSGRINVFSKEYAETTEEAKDKVCNAQGGRCTASDYCGATEIISGSGWIDCGDNQICCETS